MKKKKAMDKLLTQQHEKRRTLPWRLREKTIEAVKFEDKNALKPILRLLEGVRMTKILLLQTGVGYLVADYKIWGKENFMNIRRLNLRWRSVSRAERLQSQEVLHTIPKDLKPFKGKKAQTYLAIAACFEDWLQRIDVLKSDPATYRSAALALTDAGFNSIAALRGVRPADAEDVGAKAAATVLLRKAFDRVKKEEDDEQHNLLEANKEARKRHKKTENLRRTHCNAEEIANNLTLEAFKEGWQATDVEVNNFRIDDVTTGKTKPRKFLAQWCDANRRGVGVKEVLKQRGDLFKLASSKECSAAVAPICHWHPLLPTRGQSSTKVSSGRGVVLEFVLEPWNCVQLHQLPHLRVRVCIREHSLEA